MGKGQPIYQKIMEDMEFKIREGLYPPGQKLPSERELCAQYQVARGTLKAALFHLREMGLLEQLRGSGTYVRGRQDESETYQEESGMRRAAGRLVRELAGLPMREEEILRMAAEVFRS